MLKLWPILKSKKQRQQQIIDSFRQGKEKDRTTFVTASTVEGAKQFALEEVQKYREEGLKETQAVLELELGTAAGVSGQNRGEGF